MDEKAIKKKVREQGSSLWREELSMLSSIRIYMNWKKGVREEKVLQ